MRLDVLKPLIHVPLRILIVSAALAALDMRLHAAASEPPQDAAPSTQSGANAPPPTLEAEQPGHPTAPPSVQQPPALPVYAASPAPAPAAWEVESAREQLRFAERQASAADGRADAAERTVTILVALILFGLPAAFAGGVVFARYKNYQQLNLTLRTLIEEGTAIPPQLLTPVVVKSPQWSDFRKGIMLGLLGLGLCVVLRGAALREAWSLGLIPMFIGAGYLVIYRLDRKKEPVQPG